MKSLPRVLILAGGLGTRLASVVKDVPKPMAAIAGRPFLEYQLRLLSRQGFRRFTLLIGHRAETITAHFGDGAKFGVEITYSHEHEPLGTGGALRQALEGAAPEDILVANGDSVLTTDYVAFLKHARGPVTLALNAMDDLSRYGSVEVDPADGRILQFREKTATVRAGLINSGVYFLSRDAFALFPQQKKFSLETDVFQKLYRDVPFYGVECVGDFIDIGIPESFAQAQALLPRWVGSPTAP